MTDDKKPKTPGKKRSRKTPLASPSTSDATPDPDGSGADRLGSGGVPVVADRDASGAVTASAVTASETKPYEDTVKPPAPPTIDAAVAPEAEPSAPVSLTPITFDSAPVSEPPDTASDQPRPTQVIPPILPRAKTASSPPEVPRSRTPSAPPDIGTQMIPPVSPRPKSASASPDIARADSPRARTGSAPPPVLPDASGADQAARERPKRAESVRIPDLMVSADGWPLDTSEAENAPDGLVIPTETPAPPPAELPTVQMPDPKAAAMEAARIVGEIVGDIESAGGAAIVAAAAAGAAIEAARARNRAVADGEVTVAPMGQLPPVAGGTSTDPVVTVRMQRDRILRALAADAAEKAEAHVEAEEAEAKNDRPGTGPGRTPSQSGRIPAQARAATQPGMRTSSSVIPRPDSLDGPATDETDDGAFDAVQVAAAAIQRLRKRAQTDLAELKTHYHRHDVLVLLLALVVIIVAGRIHRGLITPPTKKFAERGLVFEHSKAWLEPEPVQPPAPRLLRDLPGQTTKAPTTYHVAFTSSLDPNARLEVLIDKKPTWSNIVTGLELDRRTRWGELYTLDDSTVTSIAGHDWLRTAYRYAHVAEKGDVPRVDRAVEYATIDREQQYVITIFGSPMQVERIEEVIAPSLRVPTQTGLPLVPQSRTLSQRTYPNAVARAFDSTVMVVAADLIDGRLKPRGGGSGVVVGSDGSILTNYHVIHNKDGKLHDVFVIGRFSKPDQAPQLWCAGRPSRGKLDRELDLALIKCDLDLDGRAWNPTIGIVWATLPEGRIADVRMGQRLWVLGYPDVGGGGLTLSEGQVEGWTGEDNTAGRDFIRTDASITHGNSGGPVVNDLGQLVGIASAFRTRTVASGAVVETSQVGLVRPLSSASCLLANAAVGWTPLEGANDCELQPSAVEAPAEGVRLSSKVLDAATEAPVADALVMILKPGVDAKAVDVNRLDDQVLAWGRSNTQGEVQLKQPVPVPGTYTVMVVARNYEPLIGEGELHLDANTPANFDPWGKIWLRSR